MSLSLFISRILLLFFPFQIFAGQIKFSLLPKLDHSTFLSSIDQSPCNDLLPLNKSHVKWPYFTVSPPWEKYPNSNLYQSPCFMSRLNNLLDRTFETQTNVSYGMIMNAMAENNCSFYLHGGVVRDLLQGVDPHDVDGEYPCESEKLQELLLKLVSYSSLSFNVTNNYFYVGNRTLDVGVEGFNWNIAFFDLEKQEYTPNSLYFDTSNFFLIDLSGNGVEDAMKKQIRIPVERDDWDLWLFKTTDGEYIMKKFLRKIPRFWKLRAAGYNTDNSTLAYLKNVMINLWNDEVYQIKNIFFEYLCIMTESVYDNLTQQCGPHNHTEKIMSFCEKLMTSIRSDLLDLGQNVGSDIDTFTQNFSCESNILKTQFFLIFIVTIMAILWL